MRVFVFTYDRFNTLTTPLELEKYGIPHVVLCHTEIAKANFIKAGRVNPACIIATGAPKGLSNNRNHALDMMEHSEWALFLVDDWLRATEYVDIENASLNGRLDITPRSDMKYWHTQFKAPVNMGKFILRAKQLIDRCERVGCWLGGFGNNNNPLFRRLRWQTNGLADGRAWVIKKTKLRFDEKVQLIDDCAFSALNITRGRGTLVDRWILPECARYSSGSYGSISQRIEQKKAEAKYLVEHFGGLIKYAPKAGWPPNSHVIIQHVGPRRLKLIRLRTSV